VAGYSEVRELLMEEHASADRMRSPRLRRLLEAAPEGLRPTAARRSMLVRDDPSHKRLRQLVNQAFTRRSVDELVPHISGLTDLLLEEAGAGDGFDAVADFAEPLATLVIAELVGIEAGDHAEFRRSARTLLGGLLGEESSPARMIEAQRALDAHWLRLIQARRTAPQDDLASQLVEAHDVDGALSDAELLAMLNLILVAGHETSANAIASALWTILGEPERNRQARGLDDDGFANLVEEVLRWQSPIQRLARAAGADLELAGTRIPAGAALTLDLGAANRDARMFEDPDRFDPLRENAKLHLAFGFGDHFCLGAALARQEVQLAVRAALERFPELRLVESRPPWRRTSLLRGLERLPLRT
jgi:cytochrome P450